MSNTFVINGKTYNSLEEMPPDVRAQWDAAKGGEVNANQDGLPDGSQSAALPVSTTPVSFAEAHPALPPAATTNLGPIIVLSIVCIGLVIILGIVLFLVLNKG